MKRGIIVAAAAISVTGAASANLFTKRQPLHDVGSCPRATIAARETGGGDRAAGCLSGSTGAGAAEPACATGLG